MSATFEAEAYLVAGRIVGVVEAKKRWPLALSSHVAREASCRLLQHLRFWEAVQVIREAVLECALRGGAGICAVRSGKESARQLERA